MNKLNKEIKELFNSIADKREMDKKVKLFSMSLMLKEIIRKMRKVGCEMVN